MSDEEQIVAGPPGATVSDLDPPPNKPKYKSWRKKYRKMKTHFDEILKENNTLFVDEAKLEAINKRLQEQNECVLLSFTIPFHVPVTASFHQTAMTSIVNIMTSQLLDILLDLNNSLQIPKSQRYDILLPNTEKTPYDSYDLAQANSEIAAARSAVETGDFPQADYASFRQHIEESFSRQDVRSISDLEASIPHPLADDGDAIDAEKLPEYLTPEQEEAFLLALDAKLGDQHSLAQPLAPPPTKFNEMSNRELEREIELRNPHSVHNWLKKHNTAATVVKEADDAASEAGGPTVSTPATGRKRANNLAKKVGDRAVDRAKGEKAGRDEGSPASTKTVATATDKEGEGVEEEEGENVQQLSASARKKGGDKDDTYRPKGGRAKAKRKRDTDGDSVAPPAKGKKARISMAASNAAADS